MCKYAFIRFTECGCYHHLVVEDCPKISEPRRPADLYCEELERVDRPDVDLPCVYCLKANYDEDQMAQHRGTFAKIAQKHNHIKTYRDEDNAKWAACEAWVMDEELTLPAIEGPEPGLDFNQGVEITPQPESEAQTRTKTDRVWDDDRNIYDITGRITVLSSSQRDAMASIGYPRVTRIHVVTRRRINLRCHSLSKDQRAALHKAGHTNLRKLKVVTNRRDAQGSRRKGSPQGIVTNSHAFTAEQRAALSKAGHGNLRTLVIRGC